MNPDYLICQMQGGNIFYVNPVGGDDRGSLFYTAFPTHNPDNPGFIALRNEITTHSIPVLYTDGDRDYVRTSADRTAILTHDSTLTITVGLPDWWTDPFAPATEPSDPTPATGSGIATLLLRGRFANWEAANTSIQSLRFSITYSGGNAPTGSYSPWVAFTENLPSGTDPVFTAVATAYHDGSQWVISAWQVQASGSAFNVQFSTDEGSTWTDTQSASATHMRFRLASGQWGAAISLAGTPSTAPVMIGDLTSNFGSADAANAQDLAMIGDSVDLSTYRYLYWRYQGIDSSTVKTTVSTLTPVSIVFARDYTASTKSTLAAFHENHTLRASFYQLRGGSVTRPSGVNSDSALNSFDNVFHITPGKYADDGTRVVRAFVVWARQRPQRGRITLFGVR